MRNKHLLLVVYSFLLSVILVLALVVIYKKNKPTASGFLRQLKNDFISDYHQFDLGYNSFYLAGQNSESIYLGNYTASTLLLKTNDVLTDTFYIRIDVPKDLKLAWKAVRMRVDYPNVYMMEGMAPAILQTTFPSLQMTSLELDKTFFFTAVPLSKTTFIVQVFDIRQQQSVLAKKVSGIPYDTYASGILEPQQDGRFSVDGKLLYDPKTARLVYLYYYRNQFITMDTSLNILYIGNTIDTISRAQIKVAELETGERKAFTMAAPPLMVNKKACISSDWIFVQSALKADNETEKIFQSSSVIDVYALVDGQYQFSFYVPDYKRHKLKDFMIHGDAMVAIFGQYICTFKLNTGRLTPQRL